MGKILPIGYEDIKEIIDKDLYYVDKSLFIKELLDKGGKVNLITRPRRFGKTLGQSMLRRFFELELDESGQKVDNTYIFERLKISFAGDVYLAKQGKFPVINMSWKSAKQPDFHMAYSSLIDEIAQEYRRHDYVLQSQGLTEEEKQRFLAVRDRTAERIEYAKALGFLSYCLKKYHGTNAVFLIDEYDVPLESSYFGGYYEEMSAFIRSILESALKTNSYMEFAVITGCLRISRESIFTGLNNLKIFSVLTPTFGEFFGFTEEEVKEMLAYYGVSGKYKEVKEWYDGYCFSNREIYNPWSIINYVDALNQDIHSFPLPYWSNTPSNSIVRELISGSDIDTRDEIENLMAGKSIEKVIYEEITYEDIHESTDNLWNFLFFTGYLKKIGMRREESCVYFELAIPNMEIRTIYRSTITLWMEQKIKALNMDPFFTALETGDCEAAGSYVSAQLLDTISFFDYSENYYHGFLTGMLKVSKKYRVLSNRESGSGRPDLIVKTRTVRNGRAFLMEIKTADTFGKMEQMCQEALKQIEDKKYEAELRQEGYENIMKYGICFHKKECLILMADKK